MKFSGYIWTGYRFSFIDLSKKQLIFEKPIFFDMQLRCHVIGTSTSSSWFKRLFQKSVLFLCVFPWRRCSDGNFVGKLTISISFSIKRRFRGKKRKRSWTATICVRWNHVIRYINRMEISFGQSHSARLLIFKQRMNLKSCLETLINSKQHPRTILIDFIKFPVSFRPTFSRHFPISFSLFMQTFFFLALF